MWWVRAENQAEWRKQQALSAVGIQMALSPVVGWGLGLLLDRWFGTEPILSMIGLGYGVIAGFVSLYRVAKKVREELETDA